MTFPAMMKSVCDVFLIVISIYCQPPPSKLFQDSKRLEGQVAERTLCIQLFPSHPHFTVRNLAKEFINFTSSEDETGKVIQFRIVCISHLDYKTDKQGNIIQLNLPYISSRVRADQISPGFSIFVYNHKITKETFLASLYSTVRSSDTWAFELQRSASGLCF